MVVAFNTIGAVSINCMHEILSNVFNIPLATGTIKNMVTRCAELLKDTYEQIRMKMIALGLIHCDETGSRVDGKTCWVHVASDQDYTYLTINQKRGQIGMDASGVKKVHRNILQSWAGKPRTISIYKEEDVLGGQSIEYSDPFDIVKDLHHVLHDMRSKEWKKMSREQISCEFCDSLAKLWKIHPFREGNTRTTVTFCCQFADEMDFSINRKLLEDNARYVRTALVAYNAYFSDGSDFSKKEYLERIIYDALDH